ncbi:uncharacterized protein LOC113779524 isoform X1 [Coffea eugenioides]|uniref:Uncharacterized protein n=1 Tax=Coffea arabica TaxID=13443 RepID=A0A6P6TUN1_COFAR|nr:uncharacterized protein LOC113704353 [Coffea arabica]XP_027180915.1 uncharacterized protein LOC113779524 isoform X1 [Coffea eugenioides]
MISAMNSVQPLWSLKSPKLSLGSSYSYSLRTSVSQTNLGCKIKQSKFGRRFLANRARLVVCGGFLLPVDPWAPNVDSQSIAPPLFALSLFPYIGFLYYITKSKSAPKLTLFGFYFLLAFVGATIPAGIYAKVQYGTSLSNVDWLHGGAESLLTLSNLFVVLGLRQALRKLKNADETSSSLASGIETEKSSNVKF